jgi:hypothetical protein
MKIRKDDLEARFDAELELSAASPAWENCDHILIRAIEKSGGSRQFTLPEPIVTDRPLDELIRIEVMAALPIPEFVKMLRNIARDMLEAHRFELEYLAEKQRRKAKKATQ